MKRVLLLSLLLTSSCMSAGAHRDSLTSPDDRLTVGAVQREVRVGMSGAEVLSVLGAPNIVSTDERRREVWAYDKIATEHVYSRDSGGVSALILGGIAGSDGFGGAAAAPQYGKSAGASATTQRTLTVVIYFDEQKRVRDFAYHSSQF